MEWRTIWGGLVKVSSSGKVMVRKNWKATRKPRWSLRVPHFDDCGYLRVNVNVCGRRAVRVHRLVAEAFIGPCPHGKEVNHKDFDRTNNVWSNLEYRTHAQNVRYSARAGKYNGNGGYRQVLLGRISKAFENMLN